jgi:replicative DNA helicase
MNDSLPDNDERTEWSLLACVCEKPDISNAIQPDVFYDGVTRSVFDFLRDQIAQGVCDLETVGLHRLYRAHPEWGLALNLALNAQTSVHQWPEWLKDLEALERKRRAVRLAAELRELVESGATAHKVSEVTGKLNAIGETSTASQHDHAEAVYTSIESEYENPESAWGLRTGLATFDNATLGLHPGTLVVIAARPSNGKSALAIQLSDVVSEKGRVVYYSLEMPRKSLLRRLVLGRSRVSRQDIQNQELTQDQIFSIRRETNRLKTHQLVIQDTLYDLSEILADLGAQVRAGAVLAVVDYLQKVGVKDSEENYFLNVGKVSRALQLAALRYRIPIIALAQISRAVEKEDRIPTLSDLRDSGQIEQDADVVCFLHPDKGAKDEVSTVKLIIAKQREGPTDSKEIGFHRSYCRFEELAFGGSKISREDVPRD